MDCGQPAAAFWPQPAAGGAERGPTEVPTHARCRSVCQQPWTWNTSASINRAASIRYLPDVIAFIHGGGVYHPELGQDPTDHKEKKKDPPPVKEKETVLTGNVTLIK